MLRYVREGNRRMKTIQYTKQDLRVISREIKEGRLIAFPTDTVYGLAASANNPMSYNKLIQAKGRPENKPFSLMVGTVDEIENVAVVGERERKLIQAFMPGAVTFIFNAIDDAFENHPEIKTIGIRMADDPWVQALILESGSLWLPSANLSGEATATSSDMVLEQLDGRIDGVVLGHSGGLESSSVIDLTQDEIRVLRPGAITLEMILGEMEK